MKIDSTIAAYANPELLQLQAQSRPYQQPRRGQELVDAVKETGRSSANVDPREYERVRNRVEREQDGRVVPQGLNTRARNALNAYESVSSGEERNYNSKVLGIDTFA